MSLIPEVGIPVVDLNSLFGRGVARASGTVADLVETFPGVGTVAYGLRLTAVT